MTGDPRYANGHRRRQLRARVLAAYNECALCGGWVDKTLKHPDDWSPEVDEIVPVSLGGNPLDFNNCRLVHRIHNRHRSNNTQWTMTPSEPPKTPTTSRDW